MTRGWTTTRLRFLWNAALLAGLMALASPVAAQEDEERNDSPLDQARRGIAEAVQRIAIPRSRLTDGPQVRAAFRDAVAAASHATVRVRVDGKDAAIGGIVGPDGWILTKGTSLTGPIKVRLRDGREFPAQLMGTDDEYDLAMLKVEAGRLPALDLHYVELPDVGRMIASAAPARDPLSVGIVSVGPRSIPNQPGILGVRLEQSEEGKPLVVQVVPDSGAAKAGIYVNDVIVAVNGKPVENSEELVETIRQYSPDDEVEITVERDGQTLTIRATLTESVQDMPFDRGAYQNNLGGGLSRRRYGFPTVFQHDTVLEPDECGGPLIDLDGRVVGFNIARAGRTESYAVPTSAILPRLFDLMSGNLAPQSEAEQQTVAKDAAEPQGAAKAAVEKRDADK